MCSLTNHARLFCDRFSNLPRDGQLSEKEFVEALLVFTNSRNDNARKSDFINAFYMLDQSCDGYLSYSEIETAVEEYEVCTSCFLMHIRSVDVIDAVWFVCVAVFKQARN